MTGLSEWPDGLDFAEHRKVKSESVLSQNLLDTILRENVQEAVRNLDASWKPGNEIIVHFPGLTASDLVSAERILEVHNFSVKLGPHTFLTPEGWMCTLIPKRRHCDWPGCKEPATGMACGRESDGKVGWYCELHAEATVAKDNPEYGVGCPNCGCLFGVN